MEQPYSRDMVFNDRLFAKTSKSFTTIEKIECFLKDILNKIFSIYKKKLTGNPGSPLSPLVPGSPCAP